jgi:hypothetical protein
MVAWVHYEANQCGIYGEQVALGQVFSKVFGFTLPLSFQQCSVIIHSSITNTV